MVSAWYMDTSCDGKDQREHHKCNPNKEVGLDDLKKKTGVEYFFVDLNDPTVLNQLRKDRGYSYEDEIAISRETLDDYDTKLKIFFREHMHSDEEIRYCVEGRGYFDVRDDKDEWIRIEITPGDLIILPAGIYHRFTLDTKNYIKAKRYFVGEPVWTPHNRPQEDHPARVSYLETFGGGLQQTQCVKG